MLQTTDQFWNHWNVQRRGDAHFIEAGHDFGRGIQEGGIDQQRKPGMFETERKKNMEFDWSFFWYLYINIIIYIYTICIYIYNNIYIYTILCIYIYIRLTYQKHGFWMSVIVSFEMITVLYVPSVSLSGRSGTFMYTLFTRTIESRNTRNLGGGIHHSKSGHAWPLCGWNKL